MKESIQLKKITEDYSNSPILRSMVNLIPYVGGAIDVLITTRIQEISWKRLNTYLDQLQKQFENVDESKINKEFLQSEEFYDLFLQTARASTRTRSEQKIKLFSSIIKNAITKEFSNPLSPEDLVSIIENLSENDIIFITILQEYFDNPKVERRHGYYLIKADVLNKVLPQYPVDMLYIGILQIEKYNLIVRNTSIGTTKISYYAYSETPILMAIIDYLRRI